MGNKRNRNKDKHMQLIKQSWSEVDDIYNSIAEGIITVANEVNGAISLLTKYGYENNKEMIVTTNGLNRDLLQFTDELKQIKSRHSDKTGTIDSENEYALSCSVFSDYHILSDRFRAIIFSPMLTITEFLAEIADKINQPTEEALTDGQ